MKVLFQDWRANSGNIRIQVTLALYRLSQAAIRVPRPLRILIAPYLVFYRIVVEWIFHIELHWTLKTGRDLRIHHGYCLVIHPKTCIGNGCTFRHSTTIGVKVKGGNAPRIGSGVDVGANAVLLGDIEIGDNAIIGAGAVVTHNVPPRGVVAGNPARLLRIQNEIDQFKE